MNRILLLISLLPTLTFGQSNSANPVVRIKKSVRISIDDLKTYGYGNSNHNVDQSKQPIANEKDVEGFLARMENERASSLGTDIEHYLKQNLTSYKNGSAILFFQQPFDLNKLYGGKKAKSINDQYEVVCKKAKELSATLKNIQAKIRILDSTINRQSVDLLSTQFANEYNSFKLMEKSFIEQINDLESKKNELNKSYNEDRDRIVQVEKIDHYVLNKEKTRGANTEFSSYLLEKDDILVVFLGGENLLALSNISVENKPTSFEVSLSDLNTLASAVGVQINGFHDENDCRLNPPEDSLTVTFLYLQRDKISFPSTIKLENEKIKEPIVFDIHEKTYIGLRVGVSVLTNVDRKQFLVENNELTIKLDSTQQQEWKTHLMTFFEFYPFGRDIDRLGSIFKKGGMTDLPQRVGLSFGVRLSKNPLETFFFGGSLALTKEFTIVAGAALNSIPEDVENLPVGETVTIDYLKEHAKKKREVNFFFGLSLSPGSMLKLLGLKKN